MPESRSQTKRRFFVVNMQCVIAGKKQHGQLIVHPKEPLDKIIKFTREVGEHVTISSQGGSLGGGGGGGTVEDPGSQGGSLGGGGGLSAVLGGGGGLGGAVQTQGAMGWNFGKIMLSWFLMLVVLGGLMQAQIIPAETAPAMLSALVLFPLFLILCFGWQTVKSLGAVFYVKFLLSLAIPLILVTVMINAEFFENGGDDSTDTTTIVVRAILTASVLFSLSLCACFGLQAIAAKP